MLHIKPIGELVKWVDARNKGIISENLLGINIDKCFMPSVANIIGTDLSNYKLITKNQFACNPMHVGRDEKMPIALYSDDTPSIVSPAYFVFEVENSDIINPDYLMLWFRRAEFDRECWFHTDGSVRGGITWEELLEMTVPVPSIDKQNAIVEQYKNIERQILIKQQINDNLESQLTATFHALFDDQNGWASVSISDLGEIIGGATPSKEIAQYFCSEGIAWLTPKDLTSTGRKFIYRGEIDITNEAYHSCSTKIMPKGTVLLTSRAPVGCVAIAMTNLCTNQGFKSIVPKEDIGTEYIYYFLKENKQLLESYSTGTTFMEISGNVLKSIPTALPPQALTRKFTRICKPIFNAQKQIEIEIADLHALKDTLISQLSSR